MCWVKKQIEGYKLNKKSDLLVALHYNYYIHYCNPLFFNMGSITGSWPRNALNILP